MILSIASLTVKLAALARGGNSLKLSRYRAAIAWAGTKVVEIGATQLGEIALPDAKRRLGTNFGVLFHEGDLPLAHAQRHQVAVVAPVKEFLAWRFLDVALEERQQIHAVEVDLELLAVQRAAGLQLVDHAGFSRRGRKSRDEVLVRADVIDDRSGLDHARPADQARHTEGTLPVRRLLALERSCAAIRPGKAL